MKIMKEKDRKVRQTPIGLIKKTQLIKLTVLTKQLQMYE